MDLTPDHITAFRYWIQGYPNFYEPIVEEYFKVAGYRVLRRPALVRKRDIQHILNALFDGYKRLGTELDATAIRRFLEKRSRLQPDFLLEYREKRYLAELKSWGGSRSGQFDLATAQAEFITKYQQGVFLLVDQLESAPIAGKVLVVSARSEEHEQVLSLLRRAYQTSVELLYLDELFATPQLQGFIERQLGYLDAAVAELKQALKIPERS
ncbi:MAG: hypothetical protein JXR84_23345 [Anaerolineae bacterium]|nr:hypothetical protein [Anaerolineae bacterium]